MELSMWFWLDMAAWALCGFAVVRSETQPNIYWRAGTSIFSFIAVAILGYDAFGDAVK